MAKMNKLSKDPHIEAMKRLRQGDLVLSWDEEVCVRTDAPYDSGHAVVSIDTGSTYYLDGCEDQFTVIESGETFEFEQE